VDLNDFLFRLNQEFDNDTILKDFTRCIFTFYYVFSKIGKLAFSDKFSFSKSFLSQTPDPAISLIYKSFRFKITPELLEYFNKFDWWWEGILTVTKEPFSLSQLSLIFETLSFDSQKKRAGVYFTPEDQVAYICRYSLFRYLHLDPDLEIDEEFLYQIVFHLILPENEKALIQPIAQKLSRIRVIDPSCGSGLFLNEFIRLVVSIWKKMVENKVISTEEFKKFLKTFFSGITGFDIDLNYVILTKFVLLKIWMENMHQIPSYLIEDLEGVFHSLTNIQNTDFLRARYINKKKFCICIGNPPYVRHHLFNKHDVIQSFTSSPDINDVLSKFDITIDAKADLYIYFWIKSLVQLKTDGVLAFVLSRSWYSSRFVTPINKLIDNSYFNLDLILELPCEPWEKVEVRTNIIVGYKGGKELTNPDITFFVWKQRLSKLLQRSDHINSYFSSKNPFLLSQIGNQNVKSFEDREIRITKIDSLKNLFTKKKSHWFPITRLDYFGMSPYLLHKVLLMNKERFCLLKDLGDLSLGSTTGANIFFYITDKIRSQYNLQPEFLIPMTKSPKDSLSLTQFEFKKKIYLLYISPQILLKDYPNLRNYLDFIREKVLSRPYFKNKTEDNWYRISKIQPPLLIPNMTYLRSFVAHNEKKLHIDKQWIGFWPTDESSILFLLGYFNSSLGILLREIQGTRSLGLGSLKLSLRECQNLLVLKPELVPKKIRDKIESLTKELIRYSIPNIGEKSIYTEIQDKIDNLIFKEYLEIDSVIMRKIIDSIMFEVNWRLGKMNCN
jgi:hypothetical protein